MASAKSLQEAANPADAWTPAPHHLGHRERLRARATQALGALPDYELLELYLFRSLPQGDVKPLAKALIDRFGGLAGVLSARPEDLRRVKGVGPAVALDLKLLHEATLRIARGEVKQRPVISSWSSVHSRNRWSAKEGGTWSANPMAGVPASGENGKNPAQSSSASLRNWRSKSWSSSVSPG